MKKTVNHFNMSMENDNQFMLDLFNPSPITVNNSFTKDEVIRKLQLKNQRLNQEIQRVNLVLKNGKRQKIRYGNVLPQLSKQVTNKQLQNAYKQIKVYQYQIKKKKKLDDDGTYIEQIRKIQRILKQKQQLSEKLRKQLNQINKQSMDFTKMLKDDNIKNQYDNKANKLHTEIKWLRQKIIQIENKITHSTHNRQRQKVWIQKLEKQIIKQGGAQSTVLSIRQKIFKQTNQNQQIQLQNHQQQQIQYPQDRTPQAYQSALNEIKILRKIQKDNQNKLKYLQKQKQQAINQNYKSRNQLLQIQDNIQKLQYQINQMKKKIDPKNLKPQIPIQLFKPQKYQINKNNNKNNDGFQHIYKYQQIGQITKLGKRFTDRIAIGKKQATIVGISFYQKQNTQNTLLGFQATYLVTGMLKKGLMNFQDKKRIPIPKTFKLQSGDHFKTLECVIGVNNTIIGISLVSHQGIVAKGGCFIGQRNIISISPNQYPTCLFGSLLSNGIQMIGCQILQE